MLVRQPSCELDVLVVGAGPAGIGVAHALKQAGVERLRLVDRHEVGASFARWPREMRLITPSFTSNGFGLLDLNAVALETSPAYTLGAEHPTGRQFARYLQAVVEEFEIPVDEGVDVSRLSIRSRRAGGFNVETSRGPMTARVVVWAAGEFQYPRLDPFPGANLCRHNSRVTSWRELDGNDFLIVGGYESGADAAIHLSRLGKRVRVFDTGEPWDGRNADPSRTLSPYTLDRLNRAMRSGRIELYGNVTVDRVEQRDDHYHLILKDADETNFVSAVPPVLCTGFAGSLSLVRDLFEWSDEGAVVLSDRDESTLARGLFVAGPLVRHDPVILCFIYKFRQRFAVIAETICDRLGIDCALDIDKYREQRMFLDDLDCCQDVCAC